jgi:pyruvate/2-oxoglutarate dehydrogenase complex dihydrolipoamide acyltransferase (E2) component
MSRQEIRVPDIGDFKNVQIIEVHVAPGASVKPEDPLITLESDKASLEVPSPLAGSIVEVTVKVGDKVSQGDLIGYIEAAGVGAAKAEAPKAAAPAAVPAAPAPVAGPAYKGTVDVTWS